MKFTDIFKGPNGQLSSKRIYGIGCFITAIVTSFTIKDAAITGAFLAAASSVFIAQAASKT